MSKPQPVLGDMPFHVKQNIASWTSTKTSLSLRLCSKEYKKIVDECVTRYNSLSVELFSDINYLQIKFETDKGVKVALAYFTKGNGYVMQAYNKWEKPYSTGNFIEAGVQYLSKFIEDKKMFLKSFLLTIRYRERDGYSQNRHGIQLPQCSYEQFKENERMFFERLQEAHRSTGRKLKVEKFKMIYCGPDDRITSVLRNFHPGILNNIVLFSEPLIRDLPLANLMATEQWRQAEKFDTLQWIVDVPFEKWSHFSSVKLMMPTVSISTLRDMIEFYLRRPGPAYCLLYTSSNLDMLEFDSYFYQFPRVFLFPMRRIVSRPGSDSVLEVSIQPNMIMIVKK